MEDWIYRNLKNYGNCFIDEKTYKKLGKENILSDLLIHGFKCDITKNKTLKQNINDTSTVETDYIITVIKTFKK